MVAYFKLQNNLLMALGAAAGLLAALLGLGSYLSEQMLFLRLFTIALFVIGGVVIGRIVSSVWASKRVRRMNAMLYQKCDPAAFLEMFQPIAKRVPENTAEHVDAQIKIAFAQEALGEMDLGLKALEGVDPEKLKLHVLQCSALLTNQTMRLHLLKEDEEAAEEQLKKLQQLQQTAAVRAPTLGKQLAECVRLGRNWLNVLQQEECDLDYLREEIALAQNRIHKTEIQLLLGQALRNCGMYDEALDVLGEAAANSPDLYAGRKAREVMHA